MKTSIQPVFLLFSIHNPANEVEANRSKTQKVLCKKVTQTGV